METKLGWTLMGKLPEYPKRKNISSLLVTNLHVRDAAISELWSLDVIGITDAAEQKSRVELEAAALQHFKDTVVQLPDGRYEVNLPWIANNLPLPNYREMAIQRLKNARRKLESDQTMESYHEIFVNWEKEGIIEKVQDFEENRGSFYLPHCPVYKPTSTTTPIRPVFDASAHKKGSPSLNMCLEKGPNMLELIPDILTRFRMNRFGVISDIKKAFLQMSITEKDRDYLRFLWYKSPDSEEIQEYRHCRVVFGVTANPFLLAATLNHHLENCKDEYRSTAGSLKKAFYVDNCAISLDSKEECAHFQQQANELLAKVKFELRGWEFGYEMSKEEVPLLGLLWKPSSDIIFCDMKNLKSGDLEKCTKRNMLSVAHKIFDPLGFTAPITVVVKIILQKTWALSVGWDEELPTDIRKEYRKWLKQMTELESYAIPRWLAPKSCNKEGWSLHVFTDASQDAYAAVIYLRNEENGVVTVNFVQARARVTPRKKISIPRLELIGCLIGARLCHSVLNALEMDLPVCFWTDSTVALAWIQREQQWNVFVQNRVTEIRELTPASSWRHISGELNPADIPSRGATVRTLKESSWWEGPNWLKLSRPEWPCKKSEVDEDVVNQECKKTVISALNNEGNPVARLIQNKSNYMGILRILAWVNRIIEAHFKKDVAKGTLTTGELDQAEKVFIAIVQRQGFDGLKDRKLAQLQPYHDEDKLIRINTKLLQLNVKEHFKRPYVLPGDSKEVEKLIRWHHLNEKHAGVQTLQVLLREKFWLPRRAIRRVVKSCLRCRRYAAKKAEVVPAPLPKDRIEQGRVYEVIGTDLAGPLILRTGEKAWIVLYTCAVYRAVHLEMTTTLSTDGFIQSFRRFCSRRGRPRVVYSDNGTNFKGAVNLFKRVDWTEVEKYACVQRITWRFSPPRLVGVVKSVLRRVLGNAKLNYEEMLTILTEAESIINHRPITYVSEDGDDLIPLTPCMFLEDAPCSYLPEADISEQQLLSNRWKYRQEIREHLKKRFRNEYLSQLVHQNEEKGVHTISVGDIVLVGQDNLKRLEWPMGRVIEVIPGRDGHIRTAKVKTKQGVIVRPIQRLYPMEISSTLAEKEGESSQKTAKVSEELEKVVTRCGRRVKKPDRLSLLCNSGFEFN